MNRFSALMVCALLFGSVCAFAADVSGNWAGVIEVRAGSGSPDRVRVQLHLEGKGSAIAGEIGREGESQRVAITNGRVEGNTVSFEASSRQTQGPVQFRLTLVRDHLEGEVTGTAEQHQFRGQVNLTREEK
jgi:hypothetical protein